MQIITNEHIRKIAKRHLYNIEKKQRRDFVDCLVNGNMLSFLSASLDSMYPEIIGTSLILYCELIEDIGPGTVHKIAFLLKHKDEWVRERASEALIKFANSSVVSLIEHGLKDKNKLIRSNLCEALGRINSDNAADLIVKHIQDVSGLVRASAIESAQKMMLMKTIPLIEKSLSDRDSLVRSLAATALSNLQGGNSVSLLENRLNKERNLYVKIKLMGIIYRFTRNKIMLARIIRYLDATQNNIRELTINTLGSIASIDNKTLIASSFKSVLNKEKCLPLRKSVVSALTQLK